MARALNTDFLHSMRFHILVTKTDGSALLKPSGRPDAGFSNVTTPEANVEPVEYKEGQWIYTRKYPGNPSVSDISMSRGVTRGDSTFWDWMRVVMEGSGEYRADLDIQHYHREQALTRPTPANGTEANLTTFTSGTPTRTYHVREAFPTRHKVAADMDATASEISIMELDCAYETFEVEEHL